MALSPTNTFVLIHATLNKTQRVADPGYSSAAAHVLSGSGLGTSSVTGGVLQITSTTQVYFARPLYALSQLLEAGSYSVTFTIGSYISGSIAPVAAADTAFSQGLVTGTTRSANGTYTETIVLPVAGYIGLSGEGAAVVDSMQIDNLTIMRVQ